jgi:dienelactone hydrolase
MLATLAWLNPATAQVLAPQRVEVPSLDRIDGVTVRLPGYWFPSADANGASNTSEAVAAPGTAGPEGGREPDTGPGGAARNTPALGAEVGAGWAGASPRPALLLLHGCGGVFGRGQQLADRYTELAGRLAMLGVQALVVDSLTPRGERELCTQRVGQRKTTQVQRRRDALAALQWLAAQPGVDRSRIGILGWSNGGSTVLAATNLAHVEVARAHVRPSLAVAFYPGCETELQRGYRPSAPLLMLLAEADDWTLAAPCKSLATQALGVPHPQWVSYEGAHHGFDSTAPVRFRSDVPNGPAGSGGVHVGGQPLARQLAAQQLQAFLQQHWRLGAHVRIPPHPGRHSALMADSIPP